MEISATIPLYGRKVRMSGEDAGALEQAVLSSYGLRWPQFGSRRGDRRITRVTLANASVAREEDAVTLAFDLPKGSYATAVLREVMKVDVDEPLAGPAGADAGAGADDGDDDDGDIGADG